LLSVRWRHPSQWLRSRSSRSARRPPLRSSRCYITCYITGCDNCQLWTGSGAAVAGSCWYGQMLQLVLLLGLSKSARTVV
jgi:hypothetical protein